VGLDAAAVGKEFAGVLEHDHTVAEEAPTLFGMAGDDAGGVPVDCVGIRTGGLVLAHCCFSGRCCLGHCDQRRTLLL